MSDIFNEVDEELRRDKAAELWKRYANYIVGAAVAIVAGTAGYVVWRDYSHKQAVAHSTAFLDAAALASSSEPAKAVPALDSVARESPAAYAALARLREAGVKAGSGDRDGAVAAYRSVAEDASAPQELRNAARLLAAMQALDQLTPAEIDNRLEALRTSTSPWRYSSIELAALAALRAGDATKARELFASISDDPAAPASMRGRAAEIIASLGS